MRVGGWSEGGWKRRQREEKEERREEGREGMEGKRENKLSISLVHMYSYSCSHSGKEEGRGGEEAKGERVNNQERKGGRERGKGEGRKGGKRKGQRREDLIPCGIAHIVCVNLFLHNLQVSSSGSAQLCRMLTTLQPLKLLLSDLQHMADFSICGLKAQQCLR